MIHATKNDEIKEKKRKKRKKKRVITKNYKNTLISLNIKNKIFQYNFFFPIIRCLKHIYAHTNRK